MCGFGDINESGSTPNAMTISGSMLIGTIGFLPLVNGAPIQLIMAARRVYGLSRRGQFPAFLKARGSPSGCREVRDPGSTATVGVRQQCHPKRWYRRPHRFR